MPDSSSGSGSTPDPFAAAAAHARSGAGGTTPGSTPGATPGSTPTPAPPTPSGTPPAASPAPGASPMPSPLGSSGAAPGATGVPPPLSVDFPAPGPRVGPTESPTGDGATYIAGGDPSTTSIVTVADPSDIHPADRAGAVGSSFASSPLSYEEQEFARRKQKIDGKVDGITALIGEMGSQGVNLPREVLQGVKGAVESIQEYSSDLADNYRAYGEEGSGYGLNDYSQFLQDTMVGLGEKKSELSALADFISNVKGVPPQTSSDHERLCERLYSEISNMIAMLDKEENLQYDLQLLKWAAEVDSKFSMSMNQSDAREKIIDPRAYPDLENDGFIYRKALEREARKIYETIRYNTGIAQRDRKVCNSNVLKWVKQAADDLTYFYDEKEFRELGRIARDLDSQIDTRATAHSIKTTEQLKADTLLKMGLSVHALERSVGEMSTHASERITDLTNQVREQRARASNAEEAYNSEYFEKEKARTERDTTRIERDNIRSNRNVWTGLGSLVGLVAGIIGMGLVATNIMIPKETKPLEDKVAAVEVERDAANTKVVDLTTERDDLTSGLTTAKKEVTDLTAAKETLTTDLTATEKEVTNLTAAKDTLTTDLTTARAEVKELTEKKKELTAKVAEYGDLTPDEVKATEARITKLKGEKDKAIKEAGDLTTEVAGLNKKISKYASLGGEPEEIKEILGDKVRFTDLIAAARRRVKEYESIIKLDDLRKLVKEDSVKKLREYTPFGTPAQIKAMKDSVATLTREGDKAQKEAADLKKIRDDLAAKVDEYETNLKAEKTSVAALTTEKDTLTREGDKAQKEAADLKKERDKLAAESAAYINLGTVADFEAAKKGKDAVIAQREKARQEVADLTTRLAKYTPFGTPDKVKAVKDGVAALTKERDKAQTKVDELKKERDKLAAESAAYVAAEAKAADLDARLKEYTDLVGTVADLRDIVGGKSVADKLAAARRKVEEYEEFGTPAQIKAVKASVATLETERDAAKVAAVNLRKEIADLKAAGGAIAVRPAVGGGVKPAAPKSSEIKVDRVSSDRMEMMRRMLGGKK